MTKMTAVSLFAGVGGFDLALERNGVEVVATAEIDKHARSVLAQHFPNAVQYDDVRKVTADGLRTAGFIPERGIITGGFPCQDLSVAGKRAGLAGARSGLFYEIARIADETKAKWLVLENVPGLLNSQRGEDMGAVIGTLVDLGYGVAWRVLDAQHFGVPQRRRRVFIVAERAGDPTGPAQVLFERQSLRGDSSQSRTQGQEVAGDVGQGAAEPTGFNAYNGLDIQAQVGLSTTLKVSDGGGASVMVLPANGGGIVNCLPAELYHHGTVVNQDLTVFPLDLRNATRDPEKLDAQNRQGVGVGGENDPSPTLTSASVHGVGIVNRQTGFGKYEEHDGNLPPKVWREEQINPTLNQFDQGDSRTVVAIVEPIAVQGSVIGRSDAAGPGGKGHGEEGDPMFTLNTTDRHAVASIEVPALLTMREGVTGQEGRGPLIKYDSSLTLATANNQTLFNAGAVRRLTPTECERLQGFPDGWTEGQADSHRYKQMGNAVAVPVVEWVIQGIVELER